MVLAVEKVRVAVPGVPGDTVTVGSIDRLGPLGETVAVRLTTPAKPLTLVTWIVEPFE